MLGSGGDDGSVRVWDPYRGQLIHALTRHTEAVLSLCAVVSDDGRPLLVSAGLDGTVRIWDPATGRPVGSRSEVIQGGCGESPRSPARTSRCCWPASATTVSLRTWTHRHGARCPGSTIGLRVTAYDIAPVATAQLIVGGQAGVVVLSLPTLGGSVVAADQTDLASPRWDVFLAHAAADLAAAEGLYEAFERQVSTDLSGFKMARSGRRLDCANPKGATSISNHGRPRLLRHCIRLLRTPRKLPAR